MAVIEDEAIVLRAVEYGESDLIAHLLMPDIGRLTVIAKYARKSQRRFPGSLDLFNHLRVRVSRKRPQGLGFLERGVLVAPFLFRHSIRSILKGQLLLRETLLWLLCLEKLQL